MLKLSAGFRNLFIISQIKVTKRLCHTNQSQPSTVRVRFAPSPTGCFDNQIYILLKFLM